MKRARISNALFANAVLFCGIVWIVVGFGLFAMMLDLVEGVRSSGTTTGVLFEIFPAFLPHLLFTDFAVDWVHTGGFFLIACLSICIGLAICSYAIGTLGAARVFRRREKIIFGVSD